MFVGSIGGIRMYKFFGLLGVMAIGLTVAGVLTHATPNQNPSVETFQIGHIEIKYSGAHFPSMESGTPIFTSYDIRGRDAASVAKIFNDFGFVASEGNYPKLLGEQPPRTKNRRDSDSMTISHYNCPFYSISIEANGQTTIEWGNKIDKAQKEKIRTLCEYILRE